MGKKSSPVQDAGQSRQRVGGPVTPLGVSATQESNTTIPQERGKSKPKRTALDKILDKAKNGRVDPQKAMEEMGGKSFSKALDSGLYALDAKDMLYRVNPDEHIDNRENWDVGERRLKAFQYDHPEIHPYFAQAAGDLLDELSLSERGGEVYKKTGRGVGDDVYLRTKRLATDRIAYLLDDQSLTYDDIERALNAIVADDGQENFAAAKRVELLLDKMLTEGYTTPYGQTFAPNAEYIQLKQKIPGAEAEPGTSEGKISYQARTDKNGKPYVMVENAMTNAQLKDRQAVADYIAQHIGEVYTIIESGQRVYIGEDLPNEYTRSKYSQSILKTSRSKAKNRAVSNLGEMIEIATNRRWEKTKHTHNKDAAYGMYRYDTTFAFPVQGAPQTYKAYDAEILIRNASDGKKYLYDIVDIKENTGLALDLNQKADRRNKSATQSSASADSIPTSSGNVNKRFSMQERDSSGRELSQQQQEYFKDSQVRDSEGRLLKLYHKFYSIQSPTCYCACCTPYAHILQSTRPLRGATRWTQ